MRLLFTSILFLFLTTLTFAQSADIEALKKQLAEAATNRERSELAYEIADAYLRTQPEESIDYGKKSYEFANSANSTGLAARAAYITALAYERDRNDRNMEVWLKTTVSYAKKAGDSDLIIKATDRRSEYWRRKERNYRKAYEINREAFEYFSSKGTSISELESRYDRQKASLQKEKQQLELQLMELQGNINALADERDKLSTDKSTLENQQQKLKAAKQKVEEEISEKENRLQSISKAKQEVEAIAEERQVEVRKLSKEKLEQKLLLEEKNVELAIKQLEAERQKNLLYLAGGGAAIAFLLALLLWSRYRSKKRTARKLEGKNKEIATEKKRSDDLLLNILPASIAEELKEKGKASAQRFDEVTVLFSDFKGFTKIAEQMSPEELVDELDKCFRAFDEILKQYPEVEKIKTIGDAYMCASGLSKENRMPTDIVKVALAMQSYLDDYKKYRSKIGKPYFEARIGLHTGPVVAGVVGSKKFAYDIWGDTVNIAARVESAGAVGKVNISETTYNKIRYRFECEHRGQIHAKNKGDIDMYFVHKDRYPGQS